MARTKASVGAKVSSGKSSKARCSAAPPPSTSGATGSGDRSKSSSGGNPVCQRETPKWQRPITNFFISQQPLPVESDGAIAGTSKPKPKRNVIESDEEPETEVSHKPIPKPPEILVNKELDETIELLPLSGENSHKIEEYYSQGKGKGKKTNKENVDSNIESRKVKRKSESGEEQASKRVKVN